MKNNTLLMFTLITLVSITLLGGIFFVVFTQLNKEETGLTEPTIDDIIISSVEIPEITTNLADKRFIKIQLKISTNSEEAGIELAKRDFQVKDIVIQEMSEMTQADLEGKQGKLTLQKTLKGQINELMQAGEVQQVYITSYIIN